MGNTGIRVGRVSAVDYATGMAQVVYVDKGQSVTTKMPCINYNDEYKMPKVGSMVAVAHLENGSSRGVIIGNVWNQKNIPPEQGKALYRKDFSNTSGAAYIRYSDDTGEYMIHAPSLILNGLTGARITGAVIEVEANASVMIMTPIFSVESLDGISVKAESDIELEDAVYKTTLSEIMDRLEALDGNKSARK